MILFFLHILPFNYTATVEDCDLNKIIILINIMKATTLFSDSKLVTNKMRDQIYMRHLREVEKINNRQAEKITKDVKSYKSINDLHHKYKSNAFEWHSKQENQIIEERNQKIDKKIKNMKSYLPQSMDIRKLVPQQNANTSLETQKLDDLTKNQENNHLTQSTKKKEKPKLSFHYRYRKRRQEQIDHQNQKLAKGIMSQRGSYLPKIYRNKRCISVIGKDNNGQKQQSNLKATQ